MDNGEAAGVIAAVVGGLTAIGGGIRWMFTSRDARQRMVDESVAKQYALLEGRIDAAEKRAAHAEAMVGHLSRAFQLVAGELSRRNPKSVVLAEAQRLFDIAFAVPRDTPDSIADLVDILHDRTKRPGER